MGDLRQRQAGVVLKQRHDLAIDRVHVLIAGGHYGVSLDRLRLKLHGGTEARAEQSGKGLDVAIDRAGIVDEPGVGAGEPGEPTGAGLGDQRAHDAAAGRYRPEGGLMRSGEDAGDFVGKGKHGATLEAGRRPEQWKAAPNMPPCAAERSPTGRPDGKSLSSEQPDLAVVLGHAGLQHGLAGDRGQGVAGGALREMLGEQAGALGL